MSDFTIIENNDKARKEYAKYTYGVSNYEISLEDIEALKQGECLAVDDGEYSSFITLCTEK